MSELPFSDARFAEGHTIGYEQGHREGWDAAIQQAGRLMDAMGEGCYRAYEAELIRGLPYPGIAKAEEPGT